MSLSTFNRSQNEARTNGNNDEKYKHNNNEPGFLHGNDPTVDEILA